jgi:hypothetical protein
MADSELEATWHWKHCYEALVLIVNATAKKKDLANKLKAIKQLEDGILAGSGRRMKMRMQRQKE